MFLIRKTYSFSASHQLRGLPAEHQCSRLHGHNYRVTLEVRAPFLDVRGFVIDFGELAPFRRIIDEQLDHRHLNDVLPASPTAERLAEWLYWRAVAEWPQAYMAVEVEETPTSVARFEPSVAPP